LAERHNLPNQQIGRSDAQPWTVLRPAARISAQTGWPRDLRLRFRFLKTSLSVGELDYSDVNEAGDTESVHDSGFARPLSPSRHALCVF
jgi:hypothetical protein